MHRVDAPGRVALVERLDVLARVRHAVLVPGDRRHGVVPHQLPAPLGQPGIGLVHRALGLRCQPNVRRAEPQGLPGNANRVDVVEDGLAGAVDRALVGVPQCLDRPAQRGRCHGLQAPRPVAIGHLLHAAKHVDPDAGHRAQRRGHRRLAQALALEAFLHVREDQSVQADPAGDVERRQARQAPGQHVGRPVAEGIGQHVAQRDLGVPRFIVRAANHGCRGQQGCHHRQAQHPSGCRVQCQQSAQGLARFCAFPRVRALDGQIPLAGQDVDHVLGVLLEQQDHASRVALQDPGPVRRAVVEVPVVGGLDRLRIGLPWRRAGLARQAVAGNERHLAVELLRVVEQERCPLHHRPQFPCHLGVIALADAGQVVRHRDVDHPGAHRLVIGPAFLWREGRTDVVLVGRRLAAGLEQRRGRLVESPLRAHDRVGHQGGLRHVDHGRGRRQAQVEHEAQACQCRRQRVAGRVHRRLVALLHLVEHVLQLGLVVAERLGIDVQHLLRVRQFVLQQVGVSDLGKIPGAVKHVLREGAPGVLAETRRSLAMDAVLGPRQIRQGRQVQLTEHVLELGALLVLHVLGAQRVVQVLHEVAAHHVPVGAELLGLEHVAHQVARVGFAQRLLQVLRLRHRLGAAHVDGPSGFRVAHDNHVVAESRKREVHALDGLEELVVHLLQELGLARAAKL